MSSAAIDREAQIQAFLSAAGYGDGVVAPLAGDASNRRYLRIKHGERSLVLMDSPADKGEDIRPFVAMTEWLRGLGHSAPEILAADIDGGFLVLEDLGDTLFARSIADKSADEETLYSVAVDLLVDIAAETPPPVIGTGSARVHLAAYDGDVLRREALLMPEWWMPHTAATAHSADQLAEFAALLDAAVADVSKAREVVVLRDYHAENLIWLANRQGTGRVGLLDYQDALAGHGAYDLVSLLEDARRDTSDDLRTAMIDRYLARQPSLDRETFLHAYCVLGAQRNLKIIGIFARLALRDGKPRYLDLIPRVWDHLRRDLEHTELSALSTWITRYVAPPTRDALKRVAEASGR